MASPEKCLTMTNRTEKTQASGNETKIVRINPDGTAREGQTVPEGTPCQWDGF